MVWYIYCICIDLPRYNESFVPGNYAPIVVRHVSPYSHSLYMLIFIPIFFFFPRFVFFFTYFSRLFFFSILMTVRLFATGLRSFISYYMYFFFLLIQIKRLGEKIEDGKKLERIKKYVDFGGEKKCYFGVVWYVVFIGLYNFYFVFLFWLVYWLDFICCFIAWSFVKGMRWLEKRSLSHWMVYFLSLILWRWETCLGWNGLVYRPRRREPVSLRHLCVQINIRWQTFVYICVTLSRF